MSYSTDRDAFIARMAREGLDDYAIRTLLRCATTIHRLAEMACSSAAADRDRIPCPKTTRSGPDVCLCDNYHPKYGTHDTIPRITLQGYYAARRATAAVPEGWRVLTEGDPRGYTLKVIPPSYAERNAGRDEHNLDAIGVPARESGIKW